MYNEPIALRVKYFVAGYGLWCVYFILFFESKKFQILASCFPSFPSHEKDYCFLESRVRVVVERSVGVCLVYPHAVGSEQVASWRIRCLTNE